MITGKDKKQTAPPEPQTILEMTELKLYALRVTDSKGHMRDVYALKNNKDKVFLLEFGSGNDFVDNPMMTPTLKDVEGLKPARLKAGSLAAAPKWLEHKVAERASLAHVPVGSEDEAKPVDGEEETPMPSLLGDTSLEDVDEGTTAGTAAAGPHGS